MSEYADAVAGAAFVLGQDIKDCPDITADVTCSDWPRERRRKMTEDQLWRLIKYTYMAGMVRATAIIKDQQTS